MQERNGRGIVIFACGNPLYGQAAYNLAMTIKRMGNVEIAVMFNGQGLSFLSQDQLEYFDHVIHIDEAIPASTICKLYANEYTPFKDTLLLDADMLWLPFKNPNALFDLLQGITITGITEGKEDHLPLPQYFFWAAVEEIREKYQIKSMIHQWRTEVMYFNEEGGKIIERAKDICITHDLKTVKNFAHRVPDELGVNIATAEAGIGPHEYRWIPAFWATRHGNRVPALQELDNQGYYLMSFGSNVNNQTIKGVYDIIMDNSCSHFGRTHIFRLQDKKTHIPERDSM